MLRFRSKRDIARAKEEVRKALRDSQQELPQFSGLGSYDISGFHYAFGGRDLKELRQLSKTDFSQPATSSGPESYGACRGLCVSREDFTAKWMLQLDKERILEALRKEFRYFREGPIKRMVRGIASEWRRRDRNQAGPDETKLETEIGRVNLKLLTEVIVLKTIDSEPALKNAVRAAISNKLTGREMLDLVDQIRQEKK